MTDRIRRKILDSQKKQNIQKRKTNRIDRKDRLGRQEIKTGRRVERQNK